MPVQKEKLIRKMIDFYRGNLHDIEHFLKVHAYASLIGRSEALDERTQDILEIAAIVHDISCPLCRRKYGNADGKRQEEESGALLPPFLAEFGLDSAVEERVVFLVTHHHTFDGIAGLDYQILVEADFLVNASEQGLDTGAVREFRNRVVKTGTAKKLFDSIYLR